MSVEADAEPDAVAAQGVVDLGDVDLFASDAFEAALARLRRENPVYRNPGPDGGFWAITRHADALRLLADTDRFSSEYGNMLRIRPEVDPGAGTLVMVTDPPRHAAVRALLNKAVARFPPAELSARVEAVVAALFAEATRAQTVDFARDVADRLPIEVTCDFLGVPAPDRALLARWSLATFAAEDPEYATDDTPEETRSSANGEIIDYFFELARSRRRSPGEDFVSLLATSEIDGRRFNDSEVALNCFGMLLGGNETARSAAAGGLVALLDQPEQFARLRGNPTLLTLAMEEVVRWTSPVRHVLRMCRRETEVGDQVIRPGEVVTIWLVSANRDEAVFHQPNRFDVGRSPNRHLGFGSACHRCVGRGVALLELRTLFRQLMELPYDVEPRGAAIPVRSPFLSGVKQFPVAFVPRA